SVKAELVRAKNIYKSVFVTNYVDWLMYESKGSPRLNKHVRKILLAYCPFSAEIREKLTLNPQYTDILKRYDIKQQQRIQRLSNLMQKITLSKKDVPQELTDELEFVKK
ncbi:MAG: cyclic nucleotide-binding domain-containing protein, partial [Defluviitaleaceae bacterium]|nr:cyclic nucleotide-binding domain-containing protein [Defluviitaleaceae bacterium]